MQRKTVLGILGVMTLSSGVWFGLSNAYAWSTTQPTLAKSGSVLGATTSFDNLTFRPYPIIQTDAPPAFANSRRFLVYHPESGRVVAGKDETLAVPVASTTKLVTGAVVMKYAKLDEVVTVGRESLVRGSTMNLRPGEKITVDSLLKGLLLVSGNDAANALAIHVGRSILNNPQATPEEARDRFVEEMNSTVRSLGLTSTLFKDPAGLNDEGRSTALDLAKITASILDNEALVAIAQIPETTVTSTDGLIEHQLKNSNRLVSEMNYPNPLIGKTGFTPDAGHCLVASAERDGKTFITVVLSTYSETREASALESRRLLDWAFANVSEITPALPGQ